jgi:hypothetical protein
VASKTILELVHFSFAPILSPPTLVYCAKKQFGVTHGIKDQRMIFSNPDRKKRAKKPI